jgi:hypothetical protein
MANRPGDYLQGEAQTLQGVLARYEKEGYGGHFGAREGGRIRCFSCSSEFPPAEAALETLHRLEGASDPADMLAVLPLTCRNCGCRGTLVVNFGPEAGLEDSEVLAALPDPLRAPEAR